MFFSKSNNKFINIIVYIIQRIFVVEIFVFSYEKGHSILLTINAVKIFTFVLVLRPKYEFSRNSRTEGLKNIVLKRYRIEKL